MPGIPYYLLASIGGRRFHSALAMGEWPAAQVHSVFRRVINIDCVQRLYSVIGPGMGNASGFLVVDLPENLDFAALGIERGMPVKWETGRVAIDGAMAIDCRRLALWQGRAPSDLVWRKEGLPLANVAALREAVIRWGMKSSLAGVVNGGHPLCGRLEQMETGLKKRSNGLLEAAVEGLIGYGAGSTPGGDDLVLGLLATAGGGLDYRVHLDRLRRAVARNLDRTTDLSSFMLRDAIAGEYHEYLQELVYAVARGTPWCAISAARTLLRLGGTSGTDMAVGVYLGFHWQCE